jgi:hypothetical protein
MRPTPETDAAWEHWQRDPTCDEGDPWGLASRLERDRDMMREVITAFVEHQSWAVDGWKNQPSIKPLFDLVAEWKKP